MVEVKELKANFKFLEEMGNLTN